MPQIINEGPGLGYRLGVGLGSGLGEGLNQLATVKLNNILQQQNQAFKNQEYQQISDRLQQFGLSPQESNYVASLPAKQQWEAVMALSELGGAQPAQQQNQPQLASELSSQQQQAQQPRQPMNQQELLQSLAGLSQPKIDPRMQALAGLIPSVSPGKPLSNLSQLPQQQQLQSQTQPPQAPAQQTSQQPAPAVDQAEAQEQQQRAEEARKPLTRKEIARPITPVEKLGLKKQLQAQKEVEKDQRINQKEINKETEGFYKSTIKEQQAAKKSDLRLGRLEELVKKGNLPNATLYRFLKDISEEGLGINSSIAGAALGTYLGAGAGTALGGPLGTVAGITTGHAVGGALGALGGAILNPIAKGLAGAGLAAQRAGSPDVEEFEKLSTDFIREAKEIFGARVTDRDLAAFMQIIPTLMQTDAGKNRVIENMRAFNKANHLRYNAMKQIIETNGGKRPANLELIVDEYTQPQLDKLAEQFRQGVVTTTALPQRAQPAKQSVNRPRGASIVGLARQRAGL